MVGRLGGSSLSISLIPVLALFLTRGTPQILNTDSLFSWPVGSAGIGGSHVLVPTAKLISISVVQEYAVMKSGEKGQILTCSHH